MNKQAKYEYTIGGGVAGALAGAALTKLLEDEDKKATLGDYLTGTGLGLGLGALGGRIADEYSTIDPELVRLKSTKAQIEAEIEKYKNDPDYKVKKYPYTQTSWWVPASLLGGGTALKLLPTARRFFNPFKPSSWKNPKNFGKPVYFTKKSDFTGLQSALNKAGFTLQLLGLVSAAANTIGEFKADSAYNKAIKSLADINAKIAKASK